LETNPEKISRQLRKIIEASDECLDRDKKSISYICRTMVSASIPHSRTHHQSYTRENNKNRITVIGNKDSGGIPYGVYPRLILTWLSTEIVKKQSKEIVLGRSLSDFMKSLDLCVTGGKWGTLSRFKEQMQRLFSCAILYSLKNEVDDTWIALNMTIVNQAVIKMDDVLNANLFESKILINELFFEEVLRAPIPVDIRAVNALKDSSMALDIYFWLTYRMSYLKFQVDISFSKLQEQFGSGYTDTPHGRYEFKRKFLSQLSKVKVIYKDVNYKIYSDWLTLYPSKTHIIKI
jgi:Plasmid encoded RepA protein